MSPAISSAASGGAIEHDRRCFDDRLEVGKELEPGAFGQPRRALAPPVERCDDTRAAANQRTGHRAPHRPRADDADGLHVRRVYGERVSS